MTNRMIYLILAMVAVFVCLVVVVILYDRKKNRFWNKKSSHRSGQKSSERFYIFVYRFLSEFPISRGYIEKISYRYRMISPCDSKVICQKTVCVCLISWSICILSFIIIYLFNPHLITLITVGVAIILTNSEVAGRTAKIFEINILQETQQMIFNVEHNYYVEYRVDDALYRSLQSLSPNIKKAAEQIYQLLLADDKDNLLKEYYESVSNKYLRAFVNLCAGVMERGDQKVDGKILYIRNLENLQREIEIEIDKLQRLRMEFLGVILCVIAPVFCIDFVKKFAISIKDNMNTFFYGKQGFLCDISLLLIIACIYFIMRKSAEYETFHQSSYRWLFALDRIPIIKKAMDNYCDKNASKMERMKRELRNNGRNIRPRHFMMRSFLLSGIVFILSIGVACYLHGVSKEQLLNPSVVEIESLTSSAKENQYKAMREIVEEYTKDLISKAEKTPVSQETLVTVLEEDGAFYNDNINNALAIEILRRVIAYEKEYFSFKDLLVSFLLSILSFYIPELIFKYSSSVSRDTMEDEVNQFNALICMLMYVDSMTVKQILGELESFAVVFKQSLRICINDYSSGDIEALRALKEREPYNPFQRIVDNLIRCDDMPIYLAFHEIDAEREGYMTKRKLANEKSIRKRVFRAYMLASVPLILLFAYGIVPTLISSMNEINLILEELESTSW